MASTSFFNLPNALTASRLLLSVVLFLGIHFHLWAFCLTIFILAAVTDWLDGYFARRWNLVSSFGRMFDPLVDKVLVGGAFIFLLPIPESYLEPWMTTLVISRELLITGLRGFMEEQGLSFGADWLGKVKMGLQCAALIAIFLALMIPHEVLIWVQIGLIYVMLIATALSGLQYVWKAFSLLKRNV